MHAYNDKPKDIDDTHDDKHSVLMTKTRVFMTHMVTNTQDDTAINSKGY